VTPAESSQLLQLQTSKTPKLSRAGKRGGTLRAGGPTLIHTPQFVHTLCFYAFGTRLAVMSKRKKSGRRNTLNAEIEGQTHSTLDGNMPAGWLRKAFAWAVFLNGVGAGVSAIGVGPGIYCSPLPRMPFNYGNEGSKCVV